MVGLPAVAVTVITMVEINVDGTAIILLGAVLSAASQLAIAAGNPALAERLSAYASEMKFSFDVLPWDARLRLDEQNLTDIGEALSMVAFLDDESPLTVLASAVIAAARTRVLSQLASIADQARDPRTAAAARDRIGQVEAMTPFAIAFDVAALANAAAATR